MRSIRNSKFTPKIAIGSATQWLIESSAQARRVVVGASASGKAATAVLGNTAGRCGQSRQVSRSSSSETAMVRCPRKDP